MKVCYPFFLTLLLVAGCKKYLDPKFTYEQPIFDAELGSVKIQADSAIARLDSFKYNSAWKRTTALSFFKSNQLIANLKLNGRSVGSYDIDSFTSFTYQAFNDTILYNATSGKITIWGYDTAVSGDLNLSLQNKVGENLALKNGTFVRSKIKK